jgi:hypothetical protein
MHGVPAARGTRGSTVNGSAPAADGSSAASIDCTLRDALPVGDDNADAVEADAVARVVVVGWIAGAPAIASTADASEHRLVTASARRVFVEGDMDASPLNGRCARRN